MKKIEIMKNVKQLKRKSQPMQKTILIGLTLAGSLLFSACPFSSGEIEPSDVKTLVENTKTAPKLSPDDEQIASDAVANFHNLFNDQKFADIYLLIDDDTKPLRDEDAFIDLLEKIYQQLGQVQSKELIEAKLIERVDFKEVEILFKTEFENGKRREKFKWKLKDGNVSLLSFSQMPEKMPVFF